MRLEKFDILDDFMGSVFALMIHFIGYLMCSDSGWLGYNLKYSLLANACLEYHTTFDVRFSYTLFGVIVFVLINLISKISKWMEV